MNEAVNYVCRKAHEFRRRYPLTLAFRLKAHSKILVKHLNDGEKILYVFTAQKGGSNFDVVSTYVIAISDKRIIIARKRLLFGYFFLAITPDLFNDIKVRMGLLWAKIEIDTVKEFIVLSNIQSGAASEIESAITKYVMRAKKKIAKNDPVKREGSD